MPQLPTGTITFLLTDIEGSSKLWEDAPGPMGDCLSRHDAICLDAVEGNDGILVKSRGEGDAVFAVFTRPSDAVLAALAIQQELAAESWVTPRPIRVRMAIHTGEAELRDGDYFGPTINRAARLRSAGHGGQVLLSGASAALVSAALPTGLNLKSLGTHRLKDLAAAEEIFQLLHEALDQGFPPLRSLNAFPNNLPVQATRFIGRDTELAEARQLLESARLLSITGSGGSGKTRMGLQLAADAMESFPDGVWVVELESLTEAVSVAREVAAVLHIREEQGRPLHATLADQMRAKRLLLVLDNCEHLVAACASLVASLLRSCPDLHLLVTSREPLGIAGETNWRILPLSVPKLRPLPSLESLSRYESVRLFIDRAAAAIPGFTITAENAPSVAEVCCRLDGIPLAIELAAARVKVLSVEQIAVRLSDRFRLLTGGSRAALPRQQTLRALVDWSHELLSETEQTLFRRLTVFAGGLTLEAAEAVCAGEGVESWEILDLISQLVDKSLVVPVAQADTTRYRMFETLRDYGREKLRNSGEEASVRAQHLRYFRDLAEQGRPQLVGPNASKWYVTGSRRNLITFALPLTGARHPTNRMTVYEYAPT